MLGQPATFSLNGEAMLDRGALTATLELQRLDAEARLALTLALTPAADRLSAQVRLHEAPGGLIAGLLPAPEGGWGEAPLDLSLSLEGPAAGAALELSAQLGPAVGLEATGEVRAAPAGSFGARLRGEARAGPLLPAEFRPLATPVQFLLDADLPADRRLRLGELTLTLPAGTATARGSIDLPTEALDLRLTLALANWPGSARCSRPG